MRTRARTELGIGLERRCRAVAARLRSGYGFQGLAQSTLTAYNPSSPLSAPHFSFEICADRIRTAVLLHTEDQNPERRQEDRYRVIGLECSASWMQVSFTTNSEDSPMPALGGGRVGGGFIVRRPRFITPREDRRWLHYDQFNRRSACRPAKPRPASSTPFDSEGRRARGRR